MAKYTESDRQRVHAMRRQGMTYKAIVEETKIPYGSVVSLANRMVPYDSLPVTSVDLPEVKALYSSINTMQTQMQVLLESVSHIHEICKRDIFCDLVKEMTSIQHGRVLDALYTASTDREVTLEFLGAIPQLLMQMLNSMGINPVLCVGDLMELTLETSLSYDYQGSDFNGEHDMKIVKVLSPGWTYEGELISPARVTEVQ